jgi:hypothetical protein
MNTTSTRAPNIGPVAIAAWTTTALFAALMTLSGILYVIRPAPIVQATAALGYPPYFYPLLGVAKLLGAVGLLTPRRSTLREWAYAGFTFDLVAAVVSHLATDGARHVVPPLVVLSLLVASYVLRRRVARGADDARWPS